ncbi:MAG: serine hydrolase domain-containing protein [Chitinophagaceae bacterium]
MFLLIKIKIVFAVILTLSLFTVGHTQTPEKTKLDQFFDRLNEKNKAMGSVTIAKEGNILYTRSIGYGHVNGTEKKPLTAATRYRVGSITKMFTVVMILQLVEEGKIKLNDTLDKFFPQISNANKITIEHVLSHRSGIHDISEDRDFRIKRLEGMTKDELLTLIIKSKPDFEPGTKHAYSNTGFQVLGFLIEKLTGKPYEQVINDKIISKIGLKDTYIATGSIDINKNESFSYRYISDWEQVPETNPSLLFGSGALISTSNDLVIFIQALFEGKLISKESLNLMKTMKDDYGLGLDTFTFAGKIFYGHTGGIDNFGSWLAYLPEEKLALAYTANAKVYPVVNIVSGVVDICFNKPFTVPSFESLAISTDVLDKYVGVYSSTEAPVKFTVTRDNEKLLIQANAESAAPLEATAQDKFKIESAGIVIQFDAEKKQMTLIRNGRERLFTKEN